MNFQSLPRRQDQLVRLGPSHGYRVEGDSAFINAELHVPPYCSGSNWSLQLWATEHPHLGGLPTGVKVAEIRLELPTPIGAYVHKVEARTDAALPARSTPHYMTLVLVGGPADATIVHDLASYPRPERFLAPVLEGNVGYSIDGSEVELRADAVANPRAHDNSSGSLSLQLWALPEAYAGGNLDQAACLAVADLGSIPGQELVRHVSQRVAFTEPSAGSWSVALLLREWTHAQGYATRDYRNFDLPYVRADIAAPVEFAPAPVAVEPVGARASDKLRLVSVPASSELPAAAAELEPVSSIAPLEVEPVAALEPAAVEEVVEVVALEEVVAPAPVVVEAKQPVVAAKPVVETQPVVEAKQPVVEAKAVVEVPAAPAPKTAPAPVVAAPSAAEDAEAGNPKRISIQNGKLEDLARIKGLNLKVAKEIVKARPYKAVEDLINVRGIGDKTLRRIRSLIKL